MVVDCMDQQVNIVVYPDTVKLMNWVAAQVNGIQIGRAMIIKLEAGGTVGLHTDTGEYFDIHSRFHIPIKTNPGVVFGDSAANMHDHMPVQTLCKLNNRAPHQLQNNGTDFRVHLLIDVACIGGNQLF